MRAKIVIVGVGALGSHLALFLRNVDAELVLVDFDRVEAKNLQSQLHTKMGLGKNKAAALQQTLKGLFGRDATAVPHKLVADNADALLTGAALVVDCLDNAPSRQLVQDWVRAHDVACLHGALAADGQFCRVVWDAEFAIDGAATGAATCEDGEHLPFVGRVAAELAMAAQRFLRDGRKVGAQLFPGGQVAI
jgi:molybdopterin/thiamine biosynthesis adenylyltransferase